MFPPMAFVLTGFPGIRLKFLNMRNITQITNIDANNDHRVFSISKLFGGTLSYFSNITGHSSLIKHNFFKGIINNFIIFSMVGTWLSVLILKHRQLGYRILLGSWFLAVFVLVNAYSSLLISYLTIPKLMPTAKTYDDLAYERVKNLGFIAEKFGLYANNHKIMIVSITI